ncbi:MotA/TolQ/ExbB proton channel family protein [Methanobrevibacter sp. DSM 116169]|uniref:MotA/TolQ/ExbB proton channel family protein n=1 Tax=Methanobrevibacter sp. DSM 116169 TaxID=3242727 RepID=UPI0038FCB28B
MSSVIPGGEFLSGALNAIAQSLIIPVILLLLVLIVYSIILAGGLISEYTSRKKVSVGEIKSIIYSINKSKNTDELKSIIGDSKISNSQKKVLNEIADSSELDEENRRALTNKLIEVEEDKIDKVLEKTDIIARIGPTLGLMGTLIPMGPGLAALGTGDVAALADAIIVAFDTTVIGIAAGGLAYVISKIRKRWYEEYISTLDALSDSVLDFMHR